MIICASPKIKINGADMIARLKMCLVMKYLEKFGFVSIVSGIILSYFKSLLREYFLLPLVYFMLHIVNSDNDLVWFFIKVLLDPREAVILRAVTISRKC